MEQRECVCRLVWRDGGDGGREEKQGVPSPSPVTLFFCKVIAFTPVGDLGRFNHTISSPGQLNQIGQINSGSTGEGFTSLSLSLSLTCCPWLPLSLSLSLYVCVCVCVWFLPIPSHTHNSGSAVVLYGSVGTVRCLLS